jgi:hypothetical protein
MDAKERYYTGNSGERRRRATMFTLLLVQVVLPTYMASAFGLDKGVSFGYNRN